MDGYCTLMGEWGVGHGCQRTVVTLLWLRCCGSTLWLHALVKFDPVMGSEEGGGEDGCLARVGGLGHGGGLCESAAWGWSMLTLPGQFSDLHVEMGIKQCRWVLGGHQAKEGGLGGGVLSGVSGRDGVRCSLPLLINHETRMCKTCSMFITDVYHFHVEVGVRLPHPEPEHKACSQKRVARLF
eukprot:1160862-Pelagomonas_calceolata.AAC.7